MAELTQQVDNQPLSFENRLLNGEATIVRHTFHSTDTFTKIDLHDNQLTYEPVRQYISESHHQSIYVVTENPDKSRNLYHLYTAAGDVSLHEKPNVIAFEKIIPVSETDPKANTTIIEAAKPISSSQLPQKALQQRRYNENDLLDHVLYVYVDTSNPPTVKQMIDARTMDIGKALNLFKDSFDLDRIEGIRVNHRIYSFSGIARDKASIDLLDPELQNDSYLLLWTEFKPGYRTNALKRAFLLEKISDGSWHMSHIDTTSDNQFQPGMDKVDHIACDFVPENGLNLHFYGESPTMSYSAQNANQILIFSHHSHEKSANVEVMVERPNFIEPENIQNQPGKVILLGSPEKTASSISLIRDLYAGGGHGPIDISTIPIGSDIRQYLQDTMVNHPSQPIVVISVDEQLNDIEKSLQTLQEFGLENQFIITSTSLSEGELQAHQMRLPFFLSPNLTSPAPNMDKSRFNATITERITPKPDLVRTQIEADRSLRHIDHLPAGLTPILYFDETSSIEKNSTLIFDALRSGNEPNPMVAMRDPVLGEELLKKWVENNRNCIVLVRGGTASIMEKISAVVGVEKAQEILYAFTTTPEEKAQARTNIGESLKDHILDITQPEYSLTTALSSILSAQKKP